MVSVLPPPRPAIPEQVVIDRHSGVAIAGFDPVAYFEGTPRQGTGAHEFTYAGAVWQFRSAANRAAFMANPEVYAPRFGGYDPVGIARGVGVPGDPRLWQLHHDRLYLFYTSADREAFAANPETVINAAEQAWPRVVQTILP